MALSFKNLASHFLPEDANDAKSDAKKSLW